MVETANGIFIYYWFLVILLGVYGENTVYVIIVTGVSGEGIPTLIPFSRVVLNCETITECFLFQSTYLWVVDGIKFLIRKNSQKWSVTMISFSHPSTNKLAWLRPQDIARLSPSVGEWLLFAPLVKREPAYISFQPSFQHVGALSCGQLQCF